MRRMRAVALAAAVTALVGLGGLPPARAAVRSDRAAAIVNFPYVEVDTAHGTDTVVQLTNTVDSDTLAHCFYQDATSRCSNAPTRVCSSGLDCPPGGSCEPAWHTTNFQIRLTRQQPLGWRASAGLNPLPLVANQGVVPPTPEDPFVGSLLCIVVDVTGKPTDQNVLEGVATLEHYRAAPTQFLDAAKYNAVGLQAIADAVNGDGVLKLGGAGAEYQACPNATIVNHFFDGALEPAGGASDIFTNLVLVPCTQDLFNTTTPGPVVVLYDTRNEFEQHFSASRVFQCQQVGLLSSISSLFTASFAGTLTGQTRLSTLMGGGLIAVAVEEHHSHSNPMSILTAAFNVHTEGERPGGDTITTGGPACGNGVLEPGEQCDDGNTVNGDCCSATCQLEPTGSPCNDGDACTRTDTCHAGVCVGTNPVHCAGADQCHRAGTCNPATGQCSNPPLPDGVNCNDGNACTRTDKCLSGVCTGMNVFRCTAADQCHVGSCDPRSGMCMTAPVPDGTACNDFNACTRQDTCQGGVCTGANPVVCVPLDECHAVGTCDCGTGGCSSPPARDGTACSNGGQCRAGLCNHPPDCSHAVASPAEIPADHQYVKVSVTGVTDADGDPVTIAISAITQDEPLMGVADGDACPDGAILDGANARVRAERNPAADGRVYHIRFRARDNRRGRCRGDVTVCVPAPSGPGCVDEQLRVNSTDTSICF